MKCLSSLFRTPSNQPLQAQLAQEGEQSGVPAPPPPPATPHSLPCPRLRGSTASLRRQGELCQSKQAVVSAFLLWLQPLQGLRACPRPPPWAGAPRIPGPAG